MKKILLIIPYFGTFPTYFPLFLQSCRHNSTIDWLLLTDNRQSYDYPDNVHVVYTDFSTLQAVVQAKFDFPIVLHQPYKLCDYKPAYGYLFSDYLKGYDFWGHSDLDLIFGDLRRFLPDEQLEKYDKIGHLGHLTLYRNTPEINSLFLSEVDGRVRYREVFTTQQSCIFDEWDDLSINQIFFRMRKRVWLWNDFFDAYPYDDNLVRVTRVIDFDDYSWTPAIDHTPHWISWEDGRIFSHMCKNNDWKKEELAYAHFQKRDMVINCPVDGCSFWCLSNGFVPLDVLSVRKLVLEGNIRRFFNKKRWTEAYKSLRYRLIVVTAPIRHKLKIYRG